MQLDASDTDQPFEIAVQARIKWSTRPTEPLTLSAWRNLFQAPENGTSPHGGGTIASHVSLSSVNDPTKALQLGRVSPGVRVNWKYPVADDWREAMDFATIPAQNSGESLRVARTLERKWLAQAGTGPRPDGEYALSVDPECFVAWWNWGSLNGSLENKSFVHVPDPATSGRRDGNLGANDVLSYGAWEAEDDEGNEMVYLDFASEGAAPVVKFI